MGHRLKLEKGQTKIDRALSATGLSGSARELAARKLAREKPGLALHATGLVHEAYLRLMDMESPQQWNNRGHFFAAAAEAMRRTLVESRRR